MPRKYKSRALPRGIRIDRGYVFIRLFPNGKPFLKCVGRVNQPGVLDAAVIKLNQLREQVRLGKFSLDERAKRMTTEQAVQAFWELHASLKPARYTFRYFLKNFEAYFKGRYIDGITTMDMQRYKMQRMKGTATAKGISPQTFNRERTALVTLFNKLKEWKREKVIGNVKLPEENPVSPLSIFNEQLTARRRVLSREEFDRLYEASDYEMKRIVTMAVLTTLRKKDLMLLSKENYDPYTNELKGIQSKNALRGKTYCIPVNAVMKRILDQGPLDFTNFRKRFYGALKAAGLNNVQFKDLRRTGARTMLAMGHDIKVVSEHLGHSSIRMTEIYVPPVKKERQEASNTLGEVYNNIMDTHTQRPTTPTGVKTGVRPLNPFLSKSETYLNDNLKARLAQRESTCSTSKGSQVQSLHRAFFSNDQSPV